MPIDPNDPEIPTVGALFKVIFWYPTSNILCQCRPNIASFVVVTGMNNAAACGHCGALYLNRKMTPEGNILVERILPPPQQSTGQVLQ